MSRTLSKGDEALEACARSLAEHPDFRVLRRVPFPLANTEGEPNENKLALVVDTETTGLDTRFDEIIEIGYVLLEYDEGSIRAIRDVGVELREPGREISPSITALTGITMESVKGRKINKEKIAEAIARASIIIAHNAAFDRPMCERFMSEFRDKPWACSLQEVDWKGYGFDSGKLKYLLLENGYFFDGHRALDDCVALLKLLSLSADDSRSYFQILMESARLPSFDVYVTSPYSLRERIRSHGYRWVNQEGRYSRSWMKSVNAAGLASEETFLNGLPKDKVSYRIIQKDAFSRYSIVQNTRRKES